MSSWRTIELSKLNHSGRGSKVPPHSGFITRPVSRTRPVVGAYNHGTMCRRIQVGQVIWTVFIGVGKSPTDNDGYFRTIFIERACAFDSKPPCGFSLEGNPLEPTSTTSGLSMSRVDKADESDLNEAWLVTQAVMIQLEAMGAKGKGNHVMSRTILRYIFEIGLVDQLIINALKGSLKTFLNETNPDSVNWVADLNYETALGIEYEPEPIMPMEIESKAISAVATVEKTKVQGPRIAVLSKLLSVMAAHEGSHNQEIRRNLLEGILFAGGRYNTGPDIWNCITGKEFLPDATTHHFGTGCFHFVYKTKLPKWQPPPGYSLEVHDSFKDKGMLMAFPLSVWGYDDDDPNKHVRYLPDGRPVRGPVTYGRD